MDTHQALEAQMLHQDQLLRKQNVVGVAIGFKNALDDPRDEMAIVVLVEQKVPLAALSAEDVIPREVDGMRTDVVEIGYLRAQQSQRERIRPIIPAGVSMGHYQVTAGTLGVVVRDRATGRALLLSNNHVFANSNDASPGDPILQPSAMDGGRDNDRVARLERYVPLRFIGDPITDEPPIVTPKPPSPKPDEPAPGGPGLPPVGTQPSGCVPLIAAVGNLIAALLGSQERLIPVPSAMAQTVALTKTGAYAPLSAASVPENRVDAAVAIPLDASMFSDDITAIGIVKETKAPELGMRVRKFGRTTGYTEGTITLINATVNIAYSTMRGPRTARFTGQVITTAMSQAGDSGSLVVDATEQKGVGLLFGGSNLATIFTPLDEVLNALDVTL
ncbi:MAG: hypothetical protein SNJ59_15295 [Aggregatilineales bacterium]